jgi:hypothetical protein
MSMMALPVRHIALLQKSVKLSVSRQPAAIKFINILHLVREKFRCLSVYTLFTRGTVAEQPPSGNSLRPTTLLRSKVAKHKFLYTYELSPDITRDLL